LPNKGTFDVSRVDRAFKVIPTDSVTGACPARAAALRDQRRTADLIPDRLGFPTSVRLHPMSGYRAVSPARIRRPTACRLIPASAPLSREVPLGSLGRWPESAGGKNWSPTRQAGALGMVGYIAEGLAITGAGAAGHRRGGSFGAEHGHRTRRGPQNTRGPTRRSSNPDRRGRGNHHLRPYSLAIARYTKM
jgi:hypothetical protein